MHPLWVLLQLFCVSFVWSDVDIEAEAFKHYNDGVACHRTGDAECAMQKYLSALELKPDFPEAHQNLALLYESNCPSCGGATHMHMAERHHLLSERFAPDANFRANALSNYIGIAMRREDGKGKDNLSLLVEQLTKALALASEPIPNALFTLGQLYLELKYFHEAHDTFLRLLQVSPTHAMATLNIGNHHFRQDDFERASQYYARAVELIPSQDVQNIVMALNNLGQSHRQMGQLDKSLEAVRRAFDVINEAVAVQEMGNDTANGNLLSVHNIFNKGIQLWSANNLYAMHGLGCNWHEYEELENFLEQTIIDQYQFPGKYSNPNLDSGLVDPYSFSLLRFASRTNDKKVNLVACRTIPILRPPPPVTKQARSLKVGYLSYDWRNHPMGRLTSQLVTSHNNASRVTAASFSYGPDDASSTRKTVEGSSTTFVDLFTVTNDQDAYERLLAFDLDIVVDLTSHTFNGRVAIAAYKPAPLVINYLGYPGSTGCAGFDYSMVDRIVAPPEFAKSLFSEKLLYLPHSYQANYMPLEIPLCLLLDQRQCRVRMVSQQVRVKGSDLGVATNWAKNDKVWLCTFNSNKKLEPLSFAVWMNIMRETPKSILIVLAMEDDAKEKLTRQAHFHGISSSRIHFIPLLSWEEHLFRAVSCDMVLDTFVYGAHTTSSDMLWMGVPVLTLGGWGTQRMPSRVAASLSESLLGQQDTSFLTMLDSTREYEGVAIRLSQQHPSCISSLHVRIASESLRAATFSRLMIQKHIEYAFQAATEVRRASDQTSLFHIAIVPSLPALSTTSENEGHEDLLLKREAMKRIGHTLSRRAIAKKPKSDSNNNASSASGPSVYGKLDNEIEIGSISNRLLLSFPKAHTSKALRQLATTHASDVKKDACSSFLFLEGNEVGKPAYSRRWKLHQCILLAPVTILDLLLEAQHFLSRQDCNAEATLFDSMAGGLLLEKRLEGKTVDIRVETLKERYVKKTLFATVEKHTEDEEQVWSLSRLLKISLMSQEISLKEKNVVLSRVASFLHNHAVCLSKAKEDTEAVLAMLSAFGHDSTSERLLSLGITMQSMNLHLGFECAGEAVIIQQKELYAATLKSDIISISTHTHTNDSLDDNNENKRVYIYCREYGNAWWGSWGPSSLASSGGGVGGSEEAVVYLSQELALLGWKVTVYADPPQQDLTYSFPAPSGSVSWKHYSELDLDDSPTVFIAWRYALSLGLGSRAKRSFLWLHDLVGSESLPPPFVPIHAILVQSEFHKHWVQQQLLPLDYEGSQKRLDVVVVPNGMSLTNDFLQVMDGPNSPRVFVYASAPNRGLEQVLLTWPHIQASLRPDVALLKVFYGFPSSVVTQLRKLMGEQGFEAWFEHMQVLLKQEGVVYHGSVDHKTLVFELAHAGFLLYPTNFPETGCITVMKAMASGCVPITSRYSNSVLANLTRGYDLGPTSFLTPHVEYPKWVIDEWVPAVISAARNHSRLDAHRRDMKRAIRNEYTWQATARQLDTLFTSFDALQ